MRIQYKKDKLNKTVEIEIEIDLLEILAALIMAAFCIYKCRDYRKSRFLI